MAAADILETSDGPVAIRPIYHASLVLAFRHQAIYLDPTGGAGRYRDLPRPDLVLLTHEHPDHLDIPTLEGVVSAETRILGAAVAVRELQGPLARKASTIAQGDHVTFNDVGITALPAHNLSPDRLKFHPRGVGNGYLLGFGDKTVYVSGDTEDIPEMRALAGVDVAFLPMNLPYTMTGPQAAGAVRAFRPKVVYPFHYLGGNENEVFAEALRGEAGIEVRLRDWYAEA